MPKQEEIKAIIFENWNQGISESPYQGFAEMRNIDVSTHPGVAFTTPKLSASVSTPATGTFTVNTGTDVVTGPALTYTVFGTGYFGIRAVTVSSSTTLPAPLAAATVYYATTSGGSTTYKLSTTLQNANSGVYIDITTTGTGTHTLTTIEPACFNHYSFDNQTSTLYALDTNQRVWQNNGPLWYLVSGNTLTSASGNGLRIFKNYLFAFRNNAIDCIPIATIGNSATWTNGWQSLNGGTGTHRSLVGQDDIMYWGDDNGSQKPYIGSLQEVAAATFDPANAATYTYNNQALLLPKYKIVNALEELGVNLMIGTSGREIYPWDRSSASFALPIVCTEKNITALFNANNQLYIAAGNKGNLYKFNGYLAEPFKIFPKHLLSSDGNTAVVGAMGTLGRKLLYTVRTVLNSGVYSVDLITGALVMENTISTGAVGTLNPLGLPSLYSDGNTYYIGWSNLDASTAGNDISSDGGTYRYPSNSTAYIVTPNMDIGYYQVPKTLQYCEIYLDRPLVTGYSVILKYRLSLNASFTTLATFAGDSVTQVFQCPAGHITGSDVQFQIILNGSDNSTPYLQQLRVI